MTSGVEPQILTSPNGPTQGPAASTLALGAPDAIRADCFWNSPERPGSGQLVSSREEKVQLAQDWKINSGPSWLQVTDSTIRAGRAVAEPGEAALGIRNDVLAARGASYLPLEEWLPAIDQQQQARGWDDDQIDQVLRAAVKAFHAEQALAEEKLLPPGEHVRTLYAYDFAAAAHLINAGARAGFSDPQSVVAMIDALGANAAAMYSSWPSFGAAYVLGHSMIEGGYPSDRVFRKAADTVTLLLSSPASPWTNVPFPAAR
ncbi:MAG: DUF1266 domain-containing protein [Gordonia sp. (in: high G+C Gram-positive bacteria)]|uniref:DUF1266 domain-containing protein n=1 Tax=Gordonia sp. (in: high G+C Gram-positive bacteria) TaxID=84139 RepID=UPI0039E5AA3B